LDRGCEPSPRSAAHRQAGRALRFRTQPAC
jgi:hypothetical protein